MFANDYPKDYPGPETAVTVLKKGFYVKGDPSGNESQGIREIIHFLQEIYLLYDQSSFGMYHDCHRELRGGCMSLRLQVVIAIGAIVAILYIGNLVRIRRLN